MKTKKLLAVFIMALALVAGMAGVRADSGAIAAYFTAEDPAMGNTDAPIKIVEFDDFQGPFGARFAMDTLPQIKSNYVDVGKVRLIRRDFPLSFHGQAQIAANAAECARVQGKFWDMSNVLYQKQSEWSGVNNAKAFFKNYASQLGMNTANFNSCLDSKQYDVNVQKDISDGTILGVAGTPTFFLIYNNGPVSQIVGAQSYEMFRQELEKALAISAGKFLNVGDSVIVNGKKVTLKNVGSATTNTPVIVDVDGVIETVTGTEIVNGIEVKVLKTYYSDNLNERSAVLGLKLVSNNLCLSQVDCGAGKLCVGGVCMINSAPPIKSYDACAQTELIWPRQAAPSDQYKCTGRTSADLTNGIALRWFSDSENNDYEALIMRSIDYKGTKMTVYGSAINRGALLVSFDCNGDNVFEDATNINLNQELDFSSMRNFVKETCSGEADIMLALNAPDKIKITSITLTKSTNNPPTPPSKDLNLFSIKFSPQSPTDSDSVTAQVTIQNIGTEAITENFDLYVDDGDSNLAYYTTIKNGLPAGSIKQISVDLGKYAAGNHKIRFEVDARNSIDEINENNNYYETFITVSLRQQPSLPPPTNIVQTTISLNKGWNLVSLPGELSEFTTLEGKPKAFLYVNGKFLPIKKAMNVLGNDFTKYFAQNAFFVHSADAGRISALVLPDKSGQIKLTSGWNLIPVRNFMLDKRLQEFAGSCTLSGAYFWNGADQVWQFIDNTQKITVDYSEGGFAMYVPADCVLSEGASPILPPPPQTSPPAQNQPITSLAVADLQVILQKSRLYGALDASTIVNLKFTNEFGEDAQIFTIYGSKTVKAGLDPKKQLTVVLSQDNIPTIKSTNDMCDVLENLKDSNKLTVLQEQWIDLMKFAGIRRCINV